jgi:hypothetical protein
MLCQLSYRPVTSKRSGWVVLPIALSRPSRHASGMNETLDAATVAAEFTLAGITPSLTAQLAAAVRSAGAAAVPVLGPGAFADAHARRAASALIERAFDAGANRTSLASYLEAIAGLQSKRSLEVA